MRHTTINSKASRIFGVKGLLIIEVEKKKSWGEKLGEKKQKRKRLHL